MKQIVIKITDAFYEKVMRYEVNAPVQLIEAVRQGKELSEVVSEHICGIQHEIIEMDDNFDLDFHFGQIDYKKNEIRINKALTNEGKKEAICHEMIHGIFVHLGYNDHANNEQLVQALGNAIYQGFEIKKDYPAAEYLKFLEGHKNEH